MTLVPPSDGLTAHTPRELVDVLTVDRERLRAWLAVIARVTEGATPVQPTLDRLRAFARRALKGEEAPMTQVIAGARVKLVGGPIIAGSGGYGDTGVVETINTFAQRALVRLDGGAGRVDERLCDLLVIEDAP